MDLLIELLGDVLIITLAVFTCDVTTPVAHVRRES